MNYAFTRKPKEFGNFKSAKIANTTFSTIKTEDFKSSTQYHIPHKVIITPSGLLSAFIIIPGLKAFSIYLVNFIPMPNRYFTLF